MKQLLQRIFLGLMVVSAAGCSNMSMGGLFGGGNGLNMKESNRINPNAPLLKYAATIHIVPYADGRKTDNPRKIGTGGRNVAGMMSNDITLDQDAATVVTSSIKKHFDDAGFRISEADTPNTDFELSGVVKDLTYNVKYRDEVSISIESTLTDKKTGKVIWSGVVVQKDSRFAGVSGDDKNDVANYLKKELGIVSSKTADAISSVLMAVHPELFNLTPGTRAIPGVTVLVAPSTVPPAANAAAGQSGQQYPGSMAVPPPAVEAHATATKGLLLVNSNPQRAKVYVDDVYYGLSPLRAEMDPGIHTISVKLEGYQMVMEKVSVRKGDNTEVELNLER
jgi:PEGA domain